MEELKNEIQSIKRELETLRNRSVHNQMSTDTRKNILDCVVNNVSYLTGNNLGLETNYSSMQLFYKNKLYNIPLLPTDPVTNSNSIGIIAGAGTPTLKLPKGTLYINTSGSAVNNRLWIATDAIGGWTFITTGA